MKKSPAQSLPRHYRIAQRRDFLQAYEAGQKEHGRYSVVFMIENIFGHARLGVTVTKKVGKANERNKLRRWVKETFRQSRAELGFDRAALDLVVNVKPAASEISYQLFSGDLVRALARGLQRRRGSGS